MRAPWMRTARLLLGVAVLLALGVRIVHWHTHPAVFDGGAGQSFTTNPHPLSNAGLLTGITYPTMDGDSREATLHGARARLARDSAPAEVTFWVCGGAGPLGTALESPEQYCPHLRPIRGDTPLRDGKPAQEIVVMYVVPKAAGTVRVTAVELEYSTATWGPDRRGTEELPMDIRVRVR